MGTAAVVAVVACVVALVAATATTVAAVALGRRTRELSELAARLKSETLPLVQDARTVVDHAAIEMERVGDVLGNAEAVSATVDSASRLAYRAFSNPVVKTVAFGSGLSGAFRRLIAIRASAGGAGGTGGTRRRSRDRDTKGRR